MICTSIPLRTSTKVSLGFILVLDRSPPLGYTLCRSTALALRTEARGQRAALQVPQGGTLARCRETCFRCASGIILVYFPSTRGRV